MTAGGGDDDILLRGNVFLGNLTVEMGQGDDSVWGWLTIGDSATFDGGQGLDTSDRLTSIKDLEGNEIDPSSVLVNFESP